MTLDATSFVSAPIVSEAGHALSFEQTEAWLEPLVRRVPIARIVNLTPLDHMGFPSWSAITPLATDLTTHSGKGMSQRAARLSAIMEAIERVCAEELPAGQEVRRASYKELSGRAPAVLDPAEVCLLYESTYDRQRPYSWTLAFDVVQGEPIWTPVDLVVSPATEGLWVGPYTNGLASGNTYTEATLHGLCELIERHAIAHHEICDEFGEATDRGTLPVRMVDLESLPPEALAWSSRLSEAGMKLTVRRLANELRVPTFVAMITDPAFAGANGQPMEFGGRGTDLEPRRAVMRALTEAGQGRALLMQGGRDTFEGGHVIERTWTLRRLAQTSHPLRVEPLEDGENRSSGDLLLDLQELRGRLKSAGFERCIVADLTRHDLKVPVVRVIVPGLDGPLRSGLRPSTGLLKRVI